MLYFLKHEKTGEYWSGEYCGPEWRKKPRFFRTASALWASIRVIPNCFNDPYMQRIPCPLPGKPDHYKWYCDRRAAYRAWVKSNKYTSIDLLRLMKPQGYITYQLDEGEAMSSAKQL